MSEPSQRAKESAAFELRNFNGYDGMNSEADARVVLRAAHDEALGLDRSVCLREVVAYVRSLAGSSYPEKRGKLHDVADDIECRFATDPRREQAS